MDLHSDQTWFKALNYARFLPFGNVFGAAVLAVCVDREERVPKKGTDQRIQKERSVVLAALWVYGHRQATLQEGQALQTRWHPTLEGIACSKEATAKREHEEKTELVKKDKFTKDFWDSMVKHICKMITTNEYGQLVLEDLRYTWAQREWAARKEEGVIFRKTEEKLVKHQKVRRREMSTSKSIEKSYGANVCLNKERRGRHA